MGNEPLLSPKQLAQDLALAKQEKISEVILFQLGGLDEKYVEVLSEFF